jgi:hypothetical protein
MNSARSLVIAVGVVVLSGQLLSGQVASAQDTSGYRIYVLESTLESVVAASGARATDATTLHERPASIQELQWRAPYVNSRSTLADPVRQIVFTFYNDALYQVVVNYDRDRTEGLTNSDIIESVSAAYGVPVLASATTRASPPPEAFPNSIVLARWENAESVLTLVRGPYAPEFQLILVSKALSTRARGAIREAIRLDAIEAPRRKAEQRKKEASAARDARDKTRDTNKAAFRP